MRNILILSGIFSILLPVTDVNAARVIQKCIDSGGAVTYARACPDDTSDIITIKSSLSGLSKLTSRSLSTSRSNILSGNFGFSRSTANSGFNSREVSYRRNPGGSENVPSSNDSSATGSDGDTSDGGANQVGRSTTVNSGSAYRVAQNNYSNGLMERWRNFLANYFGWGNDSSSGSDEAADNTNTDSNDSGSDKNTTDNANTDSNDSGSDKNTTDNANTDSNDSDSEKTASNTDSDASANDNNTTDNTDDTDADVDSGSDSDINLDGSLNDGATVEIHGSGFGSKSSASPLMFDTVERVWIRGKETRPYEKVAHGQPVPTGGQFPWMRNKDDYMKIDRNGSHYGNRSAHYRAVFDAAGHNVNLETPTAFPDPAKGEVRQVYLSWYIRMSFVPDCGSHKFIRVRDSLGNDKTFGLSLTCMHMSYKISPNSNKANSSWNDFVAPKGQWSRIELWIDGDKGVAKAWLNGELKHDVNDIGSIRETNLGIQPRLVGWNPSGGGWGSIGDTFEMTDFYADSTQARVEICDASTWNECNIREVQLPLEWSNNKIVVRLNQGRISNLDKSFLYVINKSGNVVNSKGYPLN